MNQLEQYIKNQQQKGYSLDQIKQFLLQNNYSEKEVTKAIATIREENANQQLKNYIQTNLTRGYTPEQIQTQLITQGYSKKQLNKLFNELNQTIYSGQLKVIHEHKLETTTVMKVGVMLILMIAAIFGGIFALHQTPQSQPIKLLDLNTDSTTTTINQGEDISFKLSMINQGEPGRVDIYLTYEVETIEGNRVMQKQETKAFETTIRDIVTLNLPEDLPEGTYTVMVTANYLDQEAKSQFTFYVRDGINNEMNQTQEKTTTQTKEKEIPIKKPAEKQTTKLIIKNSASDDKLFTNALTSTTIEETKNICEQITNQNLKDNCLSYLATNYKEEQYCDEIKGVVLKEDCKMLFIQEGQTELCEELTLPENKRLCSQQKLINKFYDYSQTQNTSALIGDINLEPINTNTSSDTNLTLNDMGPDDFIN